MTFHTAHILFTGTCVQVHETNSLQTLKLLRSSNYTDELTWGAIWLHKATGNNSYLSDAESTYITGPAWGFSWDEKLAGNKVRVSQLVS